MRPSELIRRAVACRFLLAGLGIVPRSWGEWREDRAGNLLPFAERKSPQKDVSEILRRMGLERRAIKYRSVALHPVLSNKNNTGSATPKGKIVRDYAITDEARAMQKWAERRASRTAADDINPQSPQNPQPPAGPILRKGGRVHRSRSRHTTTITTTHTRSNAQHD